MAARSAIPRPSGGGFTTNLARHTLTALQRRIRGGYLHLTEGGVTHVHGRDEAGGIHAHVTVRDPRAWAAVATRGSAGLGEAWVEGWWTSPDPVAVLRLFALNVKRVEPARALLNPVRPLTRGLRRVGAPPNAADDRLNVRAHYDVGNDVFSLFLDPTLTYSCAIFESPEMSLEEAQVAKFEALGSELDLAATSRLLEIGTGWGGFAVFAARRYGCHVTTTTISREQFDYARDLVTREGLEAQVTVLNKDYREITGTYSHIASIEMIEAVDWRLYNEFFATCERLLEPGGRMQMQAITMDHERFLRARWAQDFVKSWVFPGGCIPSVRALGEAAERSGLHLATLRSIGPHYVETLRRWRAALMNDRNGAREAGLDARTLRVWEFYFAYCEAGFAEGQIDDVHLTFVNV